jgi:hypothetical protein
MCANIKALLAEDLDQFLEELANNPTTGLSAIEHASLLDREAVKTGDREEFLPLDSLRLLSDEEASFLEHLESLPEDAAHEYDEPS